MSATAQPGAVPNDRYGPPGWPPPGGKGWGDCAQGRFNPWALVWSVPKPFLIAGMVLAFIAFWPIGLAVLFFLIGSGRIGGRWRRGAGQAAAAAPGCAWRRDEAPSSGNTAFDEYREDTLRRLEEEQRAFAAFLERLRFAKDKAEFDQFMTDRRQRPATPPPETQQPG